MLILKNRTFVKIRLNLLGQHTVEVLTLLSDDVETDDAGPGENLKLRLKGIEEEEILPGFILCSPDNICHSGRTFDAQVKDISRSYTAAPGWPPRLQRIGSKQQNWENYAFQTRSISDRHHWAQINHLSRLQRRPPHPHLHRRSADHSEFSRADDSVLCLVSSLSYHWASLKCCGII